MVYHQIPSHFRCIAHGTLRHKYETYSIVCIKCGAEVFTPKFQVLGNEDLNQCLKHSQNLKLVLQLFILSHWTFQCVP